MNTNLNFSQRLGILYWLIFENWRYDCFEYWLSIGVQPKYAYEKAKNII